jgi:hypothetical protein
VPGPFEILRFEPPTVYVDGFTGDLYLDKAAEVERYSRAFEAIWNAALDETTSATLIRASAKDLPGSR